MESSELLTDFLRDWWLDAARRATRPERVRKISVLCESLCEIASVPSASPLPSLCFLPPQSLLPPPLCSINRAPPRHSSPRGWSSPLPSSPGTRVQPAGGDDRRGCRCPIGAALTSSTRRSAARARCVGGLVLSSR